MYTYGWFMLRFDKKQQNSIKQLFFNKQYKLKRKKREGEEGGRKKHNNLSKSIVMAQIFKVAWLLVKYVL